MQVVKFSHSCVRLEGSGTVLVIDPGTLSEPDAVAGADAVLVTHEHLDHLDVDKVLTAGCPVHAHPAVVDQLARLGIAAHGVLPGDTFVAAGLTVRAFGGLHAEIHPEMPRVPNLGYFVEDAGVYHPGDSFAVPEGVTVETLFVPVAGTWLKMTDTVDLIRRLAPVRAFPIHDALLSEAGHAVITANMARLCPDVYRRPQIGAPVAVDGHGTMTG